MDFDGFVMGGSSNGNWSDLNRGQRDFIAVKLDSQDGKNEAWRWQVREAELNLFNLSSLRLSAANHGRGSLGCSGGVKLLIMGRNQGTYEGSI